MKTRDEEIANWKETSRVVAATTLERGGATLSAERSGTDSVGDGRTILHDLHYFARSAEPEF